MKEYIKPAMKQISLREAVTRILRTTEYGKRIIERLDSPQCDLCGDNGWVEAPGGQSTPHEKLVPCPKCGPK